MNDLDARKIGETLIALRGEKKQTRVAADIGISKSAVNMYERGERIPRDEIKKRIATYYGKTVEEIFFEE